MSQINLTDHFLIAMPAMVDPNFAHTLTYICEHNADGALGLVINRSTDLDFRTLFEQIKIPLLAEDLSERVVHWGGPVQMDRGFVLHQPCGNWASSLKVTEEIALTTSRDVLEALGRGDGPPGFFMALGYAGWDAGQLEHELLQNAWLTVPADPRLIFDAPVESRLASAMAMLGVDPMSLSGVAGHA